jgi:hypothetical protein
MPESISPGIPTKRPFAAGIFIGPRGLRAGWKFFMLDNANRLGVLLPAEEAITSQ